MDRIGNKYEIWHDITSGDDHHDDETFAKESLHSDNLYASVAHTSSLICFPLHNLGSSIDLLEKIGHILVIGAEHERSCYLRNFGVTTFHSHRPLRVIEPVLYLMIVSADCDDDRRIDYFVHAKNKEHKKREILNYHHV